MNQDERAYIIESCKFVTQVARATPYNATVEVLESVDCKYYAHGDDPCIGSDGLDMCEELAKLGRFKQFKRTPGVSTTDITGKLLKLVTASNDDNSSHAQLQEVPKQQFLLTSTRIKNFACRREAKPTDTIVYYQASCDLMHPGVIARIQKARSFGDFLYVGLWSDEMIKYYRGSKYPVISLSERMLMTLSCKYVDDIVIGAPFIITKDLIKSLNIKKVINIVT